MSSLFAEFQSNSNSVKRMAVYLPCKRMRHFSTIKQNSFESCKPAIFKIKVIFFWQLCCAPSISVDSGFWARIHNNLWMSHKANLFLFNSNWNLQMKDKNSHSYVTFSSDQTPNPNFHIAFLVLFLTNYIVYLSLPSGWIDQGGASEAPPWIDIKYILWISRRHIRIK